MAMLGFGDYLCEACDHFDTDGIDGNHPSCSKQSRWDDHHKAVRLGEECPFGYEYGVPSCYPVHAEGNKRRAQEIREKLRELGIEVSE